MENKLAAPSRILAFVLRAYRIGYAAFETPSRLIGFGVTRFKKEDRISALARVSRIIDRLKPTALVLRKIQPGSTRDTRGTRTIVHLTWLRARQLKLSVAIIREKQVRSHFGTNGATTKYQIAMSLVKAFPDLDWKLPPARKAWKREHPSMSIFDAAALGATYMASTC